MRARLRGLKRTTRTEQLTRILAARREVGP
jgi:hypothetical protein